jgi:hypothetical protein
MTRRAGIVVAVMAMAACRSPMARIEGLRDGLAADDDGAIARALDGVPKCADTTPVVLAPNQPSPRDRGCLSDIANALGSKRGFTATPPDQAAAATAAVLVTRDHRGDLVAHADVWLGAIKTGTGSGIDALRLGVARAMAGASPAVGRSIDEDKDALAALAAIGGAIPGSCPTYQMLGAGVDPKTIPPELSADHAACVQRDLSRREGPGGRYGEGIFRALEGSLALWREAERALRLGSDKAAPQAKLGMTRYLATIESATQKSKTKQLDSHTTTATVNFLGDVHAEAGIKLWKDKDAGADAEAGAADASRR